MCEKLFQCRYVKVEQLAAQTPLILSVTHKSLQHHTCCHVVLIELLGRKQEDWTPTVLDCLQEGPHSMLHEEEFFDAIDATLDKWDKEEEQVLHVISCFTVLFVYSRVDIDK